jgi:hypothetical protein
MPAASFLQCVAIFPLFFTTASRPRGGLCGVEVAPRRHWRCSWQASLSCRAASPERSTAFHQRGELSAVIELRRLFPGVTDNRQARDCVRMIASWRLSEPDQPRRLRRTSTL